MTVDTTWLAIPTIVALSVLSERMLESFGWFQRQRSDTKRMLAILVALVIGFMMARLERAAGANEDLSVVYSLIATFVQQFAHALKSSHEDTTEE